MLQSGSEIMTLKFCFCIQESEHILIPTRNLVNPQKPDGRQKTKQTS